MTANEPTVPYRRSIRTTSHSRHGWLIRSAAEDLLLAMIMLPVLDGFFAANLSGSHLPNFVGATGLGAVTFSGAGALLAAFDLDGSLHHRIVVLARLYLVVLGGVVLTLLFLPSVQHFLMPGFSLYTALVLIDVALMLLGRELWPQDVPPVVRQRLRAANPEISNIDVALGNWLYGLRVLTIPQVVIALGLVLSLLNLVRSGFPDHPFQAPTLQLIEIALAMFSSGFGLTLIGVLGANYGRNLLDPSVIRWGGAVALFLMALGVLGRSPVPQWTPLAILAIAIIGGILRRLCQRATR